MLEGDELLFKGMQERYCQCEDCWWWYREKVCAWLGVGLEEFEKKRNNEKKKIGLLLGRGREHNNYFSLSTDYFNLRTCSL